jgi:erythromycin esterase-like protein
MDRIAALCSTLTTAHLVLEWVPTTDPKFHELVRGREAIYAHITESSFREAFAEHFTTIDELTLGNGRIMLHLHRNG